MKFFHLKGVRRLNEWRSHGRIGRESVVERGRGGGGHALTCRSVRSRLAAISILLGRHKYLLKWNSFSSSSSCVLVYAVRRRRGRPFSGTNSAAIENCISCLSLAVNVNLNLAPHSTLDIRLLSTNCCIRLASLGGRAEGECRSWAKSMLDRLMHCLNLSYGATACCSFPKPLY